MSAPAQFLYRTGNKITVMKSDGYDNLEVDVSMIDGGADAAQLLTEGMPVVLQVRGPPPSVCAPRPRGRTASCASWARCPCAHTVPRCTRTSPCRCACPRRSRSPSSRRTRPSGVSRPHRGARWPAQAAPTLRLSHVLAFRRGCRCGPQLQARQGRHGRDHPCAALRRRRRQNCRQRRRAAVHVPGALNRMGQLDRGGGDQ